jgi:hypothetical protein
MRPKLVHTGVVDGHSDTGYARFAFELIEHLFDPLIDQVPQVAIQVRLEHGWLETSKSRKVKTSKRQNVEKSKPACSVQDSFSLIATVAIPF